MKNIVRENGTDSIISQVKLTEEMSEIKKGNHQQLLKEIRKEKMKIGIPFNK